MTDNEFLSAMAIRRYESGGDEDPLEEALRIDDQRSAYCQKLEERIEEQAQEIARLRAVLGMQLGAGPPI